jgi:hypothetical protein
MTIQQVVRALLDGRLLTQANRWASHSRASIFIWRRTTVAGMSSQDLRAQFRHEKTEIDPEIAKLGSLMTKKRRRGSAATSANRRKNSRARLPLSGHARSSI